MEKSNFCPAKKGGKKPNQSHKAVFRAFEQEKGQAEKAIKNNDAKNEIHCHGDSNFASEKGNGLGSIRENSCNLGETLKTTKLTPPIQIKANPQSLLEMKRTYVCRHLAMMMMP
jgi:hypothetical protein